MSETQHIQDKLTSSQTAAIYGVLIYMMLENPSSGDGKIHRGRTAVALSFFDIKSWDLIKKYEKVEFNRCVNYSNDQATLLRRYTTAIPKAYYGIILAHCSMMHHRYPSNYTGQQLEKVMNAIDLPEYITDFLIEEGRRRAMLASQVAEVFLRDAYDNY